MINIPNAQITSLEQQLAEARAQVERLDNENTVLIVQIGELNQILLARADENERLKAAMFSMATDWVNANSPVRVPDVQVQRHVDRYLIAARAAGGKG